MLTAEQIKQRRLGIGGSDVAAIMGLSPWTTPLDVYLEKLGESTDMVDDSVDTPIYWGNVLEDVVANEYAARTGYKVQRRNEPRLHPSLSIARANLDRIVVSHPDGPGVLECKTAGRRSDDWGEPGTDEIPQYYLTQVVHYLAVTGYAWADLAVLFLGDRQFAVYHIRRDDELIQSILDIEKSWWRDHVEARVPPEPMSADDLLKRWPRDTAGEVVASPAVEQSVIDLRAVRAEEKVIADRRNELEFGIKTAMADASVLVAPSGKPLVTWKAAKDSTRTDWKGLANNLLEKLPPDERDSALAGFTFVSAGSRRFLLKK